MRKVGKKRDIMTNIRELSNRNSLWLLLATENLHFLIFTNLTKKIKNSWNRLLFVNKFSLQFSLIKKKK